MNAGETVIINGKVFSFNGTNVLDAGSTPRTFLTIAGIPFKIYAGAFIALNIDSKINSLKMGSNGIYNVFNDILVSR